MSPSRARNNSLATTAVLFVVFLPLLGFIVNFFGDCDTDLPLSFPIPLYRASSTDPYIQRRSGKFDRLGSDHR